MESVSPSVANVEMLPAERQPAWRSAAWLSISQLVHSSGSFLALLMFARWEGLRAAGEFSYALAVSAPVVQLLSFQLRALLLTHSREEFSLGSALSLRALSLPVVVMLVLVSIALASPLVAIWLLIRTVDAWAELLQSELQRLNRVSAACWGSFIRTPVFVLCIVLTSDPGVSSALYLLLSLVILVLVDSHGLSWKIKFEFTPLRRWARNGVALGVVLFLYLAATNIPRIVLEKYVGPDALGSFAALFVFAQSGNLVASALGQSLLPSFSVSPPKRILAWLGLPALAALVVLPVFYQCDEVLLKVLNIPASYENRSLLHTTAWCQCVIWPAAMSGYALTARRLYGSLQKVAWGMVAISVVVSLLLVPSAGPIGAAIAVACQAGFLLGFTIVILVIRTGS